MKWVQKIDDCGTFVKQIKVQFLKEYHSLGQILHVSMTAPWKTPEAWATHTKCESLPEAYTVLPVYAKECMGHT